MITPTVGRIVHFYPSDHDNMMVRHGNNPMAAIVTAVWNERMVNLTVFDANGIVHNITSVHLQQPGDPPVVAGTRHCEWMPYQQGQAAQTNELTPKLQDLVERLMKLESGSTTRTLYPNERGTAPVLTTYEREGDV